MRFQPFRKTWNTPDVFPSPSLTPDLSTAPLLPPPEPPQSRIYIVKTRGPERHKDTNTSQEGDETELEEEDGTTTSHIMAHNCFLRSLITLLHACTAIGTGFVCVFSLIGYNSGKANDCLPSLVDRFGDPITLRSGIPSMCDGILFTLAGLCALNFCMSLFINCHWRNTCVIVLHLVMTLLMFAFSAYSATLFTVHHLLWCDSLLQTVSYSNIGCEEASLRYDRFHTTSNMSDYYKRMEVQQAGLWALVPVLFITSLVYAFSMRVSASWSVDSDDLRGQFRYVILDDESTPILRPQPNTPRALDTPPYSNSFSENTTDINNVGNNSNNNYNDGNNEINNGNNDNSNPFEEN